MSNSPEDNQVIILTGNTSCNQYHPHEAMHSLSALTLCIITHTQVYTNENNFVITIALWNYMHPTTCTVAALE